MGDIENGHTFGDEINLVKPGFNTGSPRFQGTWPITNSSHLFNNPPPGLPKGYYFSETPQRQEDFGTLDFDGNGDSNPEFTWNHTVGVTSIKFLNSNKLGKQYENDVFVGTFKGGLVYHFELNEDRTGLLFEGLLKDKVAYNDEELNDIIFLIIYLQME